MQAGDFILANAPRETTWAAIVNPGPVLGIHGIHLDLVGDFKASGCNA
jgi:hypothetical protein